MAAARSDVSRTKHLSTLSLCTATHAKMSQVTTTIPESACEGLPAESQVLFKKVATARLPELIIAAKNKAATISPVTNRCRCMPLRALVEGRSVAGPFDRGGLETESRLVE